MLLIALLTTASLVGGWLLRPRGLTPGLEGVLFRILLGLLVTVTVLLPVARDSLATAIGLLIAAALVGMTHEVFRRRHGALPGTPPPPPRLDAVEWSCVAALMLMGATALVRGLAFPIDPEALIVHLALAKEAVLENGLRGHDRHPFSHGTDLGFAVRSLLYLWKSTVTVTAWQTLTAFLATVALYALVRRAATRRAALLAATAFAAMPAMVTLPMLGGNDLLAAAFVFMALVAVLRWQQEGQSVCGVLAGAMMGGACATGAPGWLALPAWFLFLAAVRPRGLPRTLAIAGIPTVMAALPWWLMAAPAPVGSAGMEALRAWVSTSGTPPLNLMLAGSAPPWPVPEGRWPFFPWDAIMRPSWYEGPWFSPGPLALVAGLPALLYADRDARRIAGFALAFGLAVMLLHPSTRLIVPACALMIAVAAIAIERTPQLRTIGRLAFALAIGMGIPLHIATAAERARVVSGLETGESWRARQIEAAPAFMWCNTHLEEGLILSLDPRGFLLDGPAFVNYPAIEALPTRTVAGQAQWLRERRIRYVIHPEREVQRNPAFRAAGIATMASQWRDFRNYFIQRAAFELDDGSALRVYEVRHVDAPR